MKGEQPKTESELTPGAAKLAADRLGVGAAGSGLGNGDLVAKSAAGSQPDNGLAVAADREPVTVENAGGQSLESQLPTGGQIAENTSCPPVGSELKTPQCNVIEFKLPTGGQIKSKPRKQKTSPKLPTGGQTKVKGRLPTGGQSDESEWLKSILPTLQIGCWWEVPADDKGFKIKLGWRVSGQKKRYVFKRLGKYEIQTLKEKTYDRQQWLIRDRLLGEIYSERRADLAARFGAGTGYNRVNGAENRASG